MSKPICVKKLTQNFFMIFLLMPTPYDFPSSVDEQKKVFTLFFPVQKMYTETTGCQAPKTSEEAS